MLRFALAIKKIMCAAIDTQKHTCEYNIGSFCDIPHSENSCQQTQNICSRSSGTINDKAFIVLRRAVTTERSLPLGVCIPNAGAYVLPG